MYFTALNLASQNLPIKLCHSDINKKFQTSPHPGTSFLAQKAHEVEKVLDKYLPMNWWNFTTGG
jgi:hypothetical protein